MFMGETIMANSIAMVLLVCLLFNYRRKRASGGQCYPVILRMVVINILQCVFDTAGLVLDGKQFFGASVITLLLNSFLYLNTSLFGKTWVDMNYIRIFGTFRLKHNKKFRILTYIPFGIVAILVGINLFTPIIFYIDPVTLLYERRIGYAITFGLTYVYILWGLLLAVINSKKAQRYLIGTVTHFVIPVAVASVVQFLLSGLSLLWVGSAIGIISAYLIMQDESAMIDSLSGVYSRAYLFSYLGARLGKADDDTKLVGIMIDINKFKSINDEYGHQAGDSAISHMGAILRSSVPVSNGIAARYGGDEFIIVAAVKNEAEVSAILSEVNHNISLFNRSSVLPFELSISAGHTFRQKDDTQDRFIMRMDMEMYRHKPGCATRF